ncbi:response regulator [Sphingomonas ginkgonis]|uniref:Response regulator n=1 Tax=Sphingomonas ginkgonis TaxID=2315330 RepID=A0A429VA43_9SPHN|nr:response regulator [Sphingomonas ginkgonis]RST30697.1 response regulator [Sphingomonas ginkgonis]
MEQPRLLLIDDEPALADYVAAAARHCGYKPMVARDQRDFFSQFTTERPDMVALDLGMPEMDGVELLRLLAENQFDGPVLIISGFDRRVLESAFRLGEALGLTMVGPLEKPARLEALEDLFTRLKPTPAN